MYSGHIFNFNHQDSKGTTLSAHIWKLKNEDKRFEISWKILEHARPFTPTNEQCALCTAEKKIIIYQSEKATLNTRNELKAHCKHKESRLLIQDLVFSVRLHLALSPLSLGHIPYPLSFILYPYPLFLIPYPLSRSLFPYHLSLNP